VERTVQAHVARDLQVSALDWELKLKLAKLVVALYLEARLEARHPLLLLPPQRRPRLLLLRTTQWQALLQRAGQLLILLG